MLAYSGRSTAMMNQKPKRNNNLNRWLYDGCSDGEEEIIDISTKVKKSLVVHDDDIPPPPPPLSPPPPPAYDENIVLHVNIRRQSMVKPDSPVVQLHASGEKQLFVAKAPAAAIAIPKLQPQEISESVSETKASPQATDVADSTEYAAEPSPVRKPQNVQQRRHSMGAKPSKDQKVVPLEPPSSSAKKRQSTVPVPVASTARKPSKSVDPRIMWEKKLADAEKREKEAQTHAAELQRKVVSLEDRIRAIKNNESKKRATVAETKIKQPSHSLETLEAKIVSEVSKIVQDREINDELMQQLSNAVTAAVAQTLLAASKAVAPPRRLPPAGPIAKALQLAQI